MAVVVVFAALTWWQLHAATRESAAQEALWRNGVIVDVRHCDQPTSEAANLHCAALICAQRVTRQLTNPQQTRLTLTSFTRDESTGEIKVEGDLAQVLSSPTLPTRFCCRSATRATATPTLEYAKLVRGAP
ncbi:MAG: hypothetical protein K2Y51_18445 [Gammaproteobacteria bacterium]|nr:hypothetical protein [Gammaproteobacteria bacterium]